jgi:hypothetical protein
MLCKGLPPTSRPEISLRRLKARREKETGASCASRAAVLQSCCNRVGARVKLQIGHCQRDVCRLPFASAPNANETARIFDHTPLKRYNLTAPEGYFMR